MKILINGYVGPKITGIGRTLIETLGQIAVLNEDVTYVVYTNYDNCDFFNMVFPKNVHLKKIFITKTSSLKNLLYNLCVFPFLALKERADIVYYPNFTIIPFAFKPVVSVIHDMIEFKVAGKFSALRTFYRFFIVPRMAKVSENVITVSENSKKDIVEICKIPTEKIAVVYDAVSEKFENKKKSSLRPLKEDYMLYVGTIDYPGKNVYNSIKAFEVFKTETVSDLKFVICGMPGKDFYIVEELMKKSKFSSDIIYKGFVNDDELLLWYSHAAAFIFISYYEGFGLPVLEAMKFGVPVITSNRSSLPEVAGDAALICDPDDINGVAKAIKKVICSEELKQALIKKGFENLKRFSWNTTAEKTLEIFTKAAEK